MNVQQAIRTKRAIREFEDRALPDDAIRTILNAGRRSQSSMNTQPWQFVAVTARDLLTRLGQAAGHAGHLKGAALGVFILVPSEGKWPVFDCGQCAAYMQLAAWGLGIGSCLGNFVEEDKARQMLGYPHDLKLVVCLSFGYPTEAAASRPLKAGGRKPLEDLVHWNRW